jgi:hypothetical protein
LTRGFAGVFEGGTVKKADSYGMTNKRTDNSKSKGKGQYGDSGCARMTK